MGYLGPFARKLKPGNIQSMIFKPSDEGPFYMPNKEHDQRQKDTTIEVETIKKPLTKGELKKLLEVNGIQVQGMTKELKQIALQNNLPIEVQQQKITPGWEEKPKGLLQVLCEQGWINETKLLDYTLKGKQDAFRVMRMEMSLKALMENCEDFEEEESLLQQMGREMGILVD